MVFAMTLQYAYLFGIVPALMLGAIDDILYHVRKIGWIVRILIVGADRFRRLGIALRLARAGLRRRRSSSCTDWSALCPATLSSWLAHKYAEEQRPAVSA